MFDRCQACILEVLALGSALRAHAGISVTVIALGALVFAVFVTRATLTPVTPLVLLVLLSSLTSAFKVQFPIASGSNMSVSYVVDIAALLLRGPDAAMIVGAASGWSQTTLNAKTRNPAYRILFNMAILVITVQAAGQVYRALGGRRDADVALMIIPLAGMALTYFFVNTIPIAIAIALTTRQQAWRVWKTDFFSSAPSYLLGAAAAAVVIAGDGEQRVLADAAPHCGAVVSDLQNVSRRRRKRSPPGCHP